MARKNKPSRPRNKISPEQAAKELAIREAAAKVKADQRAEVRRLKRLGLEVVTHADGSLLRAQRLDVVQMLINSKAITGAQETAYRRLETMLEAVGSSPKSCLSSLDRVHGGGDASTQEQRRLDATKELLKLERSMPASDWGFLRELAEGGGLLTKWRTVSGRWTRTTDEGDLMRAVIQVLVRLETARPTEAKTNDFIGGMLDRAEEAA